MITEYGIEVEDTTESKINSRFLADVQIWDETDGNILMVEMFDNEGEHDQTFYDLRKTVVTFVPDIP